MKTIYAPKNETISTVTAIASIFASMLAGLACIGPMLGIALGISGLGWLSSYNYLTIPGAIASVLLLAAALYLFTRRQSSCASRRKRILNNAFLAMTALIVVAVNVFEFLILPNLS